MLYISLYEILGNQKRTLLKGRKNLSGIHPFYSKLDYITGTIGYRRVSITESKTKRFIT